MNSGSKLDISKSSLLSLKAELARKHEEATKAKAQAQGNYIKPVGKPTKSSIFSRSNLGVENRQIHDIPELTADEESKIQRSRSALEKKAKIYESLSQDKSHGDSSDYLVDFAQKSSDASRSALYESEREAEERRRREKEEEEEEARRADSDEYDAPSDPEDDWVDFTDSLGRTRRCLRRDLPRFRELDDRLFRSLEPKVPSEDEGSRPSGFQPPEGPSFGSGPDLCSDDMRREQQRLKWEEEEEKLRDKSDIHYQDVLFDEARTHGVGYFPFAREAGARKAQQDALRTLRKETESKQKAALTQREKRERMMQARLRAAHNRKRAREGLPPLGEDEELPGAKKEEPEELEEPAPSPVPTVQRGKGPRPSPAVREWDIGKEGVPVLTQSEWNEQQRAARKQEFAPPSFYEDRQGDHRNRKGDRQGRKRDQDGDKGCTKRAEPQDDDEPGPPPPSKSPSPPPGPPVPSSSLPPAPVPPPTLGPEEWMRVPPPPFMPPVHLPPPSMGSWRPLPPAEEQADDGKGGLYFTSKRPKHDWRAAQGARPEVRLPMEEEEDFTSEPPPPGVDDAPPPEPRRPPKRDVAVGGGSDAGRVGAEIAPPSTIEYFGPSEMAADRSRKAAQRGAPSQSELSDSITAGLRFLRQEAEKKEQKRTDKGWADFM